MREVNVVGKAQEYENVADPNYVPDFTPLPLKRFDVSNNVKDKACGCCTTRTFILKDNEAILKNRNCFMRSKKRKPYANLIVAAHRTQPVCIPCPVGFSSDFNDPNPNADAMAEKDPTIDPDDPEIQLPIVPGCGCEGDMVDEIVTEINDRRVKRGNIAQMVRLEYMSEKVFRLATQVPVVLDSLGGSHEFKYPPKPDPPQTFETREFDVSKFGEFLCCSGQTLTLEQDEIEWKIQKCFGMMTRIKRREYVHIGGAEVAKQCICFRSVDSDLGPPIQPGCGCQKAKVGEIVMHMRQRMAVRGAMGQMLRQERVYKQLAELDSELPKVSGKLEAVYPPPQEKMGEIFGGKQVDLKMLKEQGVTNRMGATEPLEMKTYDVTNKCEACGTLVGTCGIAGCTTETIELAEDHMMMKEVNNIDTTDIFLPYAEMESVDMQRECLCCYKVNDFVPGFGCFNKEIVESLAADLQARKLARGNIAQLQQLETMEKTALELNCQMDVMLNHEGIAYPPSQDDLNNVYGAGGPPEYVSKLMGGPLHIEAAAEFPTKEYNVTNWWECAALWYLGGYWRTLTLQPEELNLVESNLCLQRTTRTPYANVDSLESETVCFCCSELPELANPGCGCSTELVEEIAGHLQERLEKRGDVAQLKMQENVTYELLKLDLKTDLLTKKRNIEYPPGQEVMGKVFGAHATPEFQAKMNSGRAFTLPPKPSPPKRTSVTKGNKKETE